MKRGIVVKTTSGHELCHTIIFPFMSPSEATLTQKIGRFPNVRLECIGEQVSMADKFPEKYYPTSLWKFIRSWAGEGGLCKWGIRQRY
jgi:hypothetical protein